MKKPNYKLKADILNENNFLHSFIKVEKQEYRFFNDKISYEEYEVSRALRDYLYKSNREWYEECGRMSHARCKRVVRIRKYITDIMISSPCQFLTFTFTDKSLQDTSPETRRQVVRRFLTDLNVPYVANIDFGKKNGREHYHAVVASGKVNYKLWDYGALNGKVIRNDVKVDEDGSISIESAQKISRYIAKLTNHAIKQTVRRNVAIYCRKKYKYINGEWQDIKGKIKND